MKKYNLIFSNIDSGKITQEVFQSDLSRKIMTGLGARPPEPNYWVEKILGKLKDFSA